MIATAGSTDVNIMSQTEITSLEIASLGICSEGNGYSYLKSKQMIYTILLKMIGTLIAYIYCMLCTKNIVLSILLVQIVLICSHFVSQKLVKDILPHGILKEWLP